MKETDYNKQATDFCNKTGVKIEVTFLKYDYHFTGDKEKRDIYKVKILRGNRSFSFNFGQSIASTGEYIGHRNMCINEFGKHVFTKLEFRNALGGHISRFYIRKNPAFKAPDEYDILSCLTKYDVGTLDDFCSEFGYDIDSKAVEKMYNAVCKEFDNVCKIWTDEEIEELQGIN